LVIEDIEILRDLKYYKIQIIISSACTKTNNQATAWLSFRIYFGIWLSSYYRFWNKFRM